MNKYNVPSNLRVKGYNDGGEKEETYSLERRSFFLNSSASRTPN